MTKTPKHLQNDAGNGSWKDVGQYLRMSQGHRVLHPWMNGDVTFMSQAAQPQMKSSSGLILQTRQTIPIPHALAINWMSR